MSRGPRAWRLALAALALSFLPGPVGALTIVGFSPQSASAALGDTLSVAVVADTDELLLGFGIDVSFDPTVFALVAAPVIGPLWTPVFAPDGDGLAGLAPPEGLTGSGLLLATLELQAVGVGSTLLSVSATPGDLTEGFALKSGGFDVAHFGAGSLVVVPEPSARPLLAWAAAALLVVATRRGRRGGRSLGVALCLVAASAQPALAQDDVAGRDPVFEELANPFQSSQSHRAAAIAADGGTVFGHTVNGFDAFRWREGSFRYLSATPMLLSGIQAQHRYLFDATADGSSTVGVFADSVFVDHAEAMVWTPTLFGGITDYELLGALPGDSHSVASAISSDGSVIVGWSATEVHLRPHDGIAELSCTNGPCGVPRAFRTDSSAGLVAMPHPAGFTLSHANAVSSNGRFAVGGLAPGDMGAQQPFRWNLETDEVEPLGLLPGWRWARARTVSDDGTIVFGVACLEGVFPCEVPFRWTEAQGLEVLPIPGDATRLDAITSASDDGALLFGLVSPPAGSAAFVWSEGEGSRMLTPALAADWGIDFGTRRIRRVNAVGSADRLTLVGTTTEDTGLSPHLGLRLIAPCDDVDRDGLCDRWERAGGLDLDGDGTISPCQAGSCPDLELAWADPEIMDIFVEVDRVAGSAFDPGALLDVEQAFADVPAALIANGQPFDGIQLHLELDEQSLTLASGALNWAAKTGDACGVNGLPDMATFRATRFGSPAQRANPAVLQAKRKIYRHLVYGGIRANGRSGIADPLGNEATVTLDNFDNGAPSRDWQAGTIMHELGHTLGLKHGGADHTKYKPNYFSAMNYTWQLRGNKNVSHFLGALLFDRSWVLDYSRRALVSLDEDALIEPLGIDASPYRGVPVGPLRPCGGGQCARMVVAWAGIDWDESGSLDAFTVGPVDVNQITSSAGAGTVHPGFDDWTHLTASLRSTFEHPNWDDTSAAGSCDGWNGAPEDLENWTPAEAEALLTQDFFLDCNANGVADTEDLALGVDVDADGNGVLDGCQPLRGDLDEDGDVDLDDRTLLVAAFGRREGEPAYRVLADLDQDRIVTHLDYQQWVAAYDAFQAGTAEASASSTTACGLLGLEPLVLVAMLAARQRRRRALEPQLAPTRDSRR